jgi:large subunit ribosomal protein L17
MRHGKKGKQLGRIRKLRKALLRSQAVSLVEHGRIKTTLAKAKLLQPYFEKIITRAKKAGMLTYRELRKDFNEATVKSLVEKVAPLFAERNGGYTRVIKLKPRRSDASPMALVELVEKPKELPKEKGKKAEKPVKKAKPEKPAKP